MKPFLLFSFCTLLPLNAPAQDSLTLVTGQHVAVYIQSIDKEHVCFTMSPYASYRTNTITCIATDRIEKIQRDKGDTLIWSKQFDAIDSSVNPDSANAQKLGLTLEQYQKEKNFQLIKAGMRMSAAEIVWMMLSDIGMAPR
jgi:hypothetical protein